MSKLLLAVPKYKLLHNYFFTILASHVSKRACNRPIRSLVDHMGNSLSISEPIASYLQEAHDTLRSAYTRCCSANCSAKLDADTERAVRQWLDRALDMPEVSRADASRQAYERGFTFVDRLVQSNSTELDTRVTGDVVLHVATVSDMAELAARGVSFFELGVVHRLLAAELLQKV